MTYTPNSKNLSRFCRWHKIVSLAVFLTFSSSIISPAFADTQIGPQEPPDKIIKTQENNKDSSIENNENSQTTEKDNGAITSEGAQIQENIPPVLTTTEIQLHNQDELNTIGNTGYNNAINAIGMLAHYVAAPLSKDEKENLEKFLSFFFDPNNAKFYANYFDTIRPLTVKEITKKSLGRGARSLVYTGNLKAAYSLTDSGNFLRRAPAEATRNFGTLIKKANAKKDYEESGKILRNALVAHILILPLQIATGFATGPAFRALGQPNAVCDSVSTYSKWSSLGSTATELSGMTADKALALERSEYQWAPSVSNAFLTQGFYHGLNAVLGAPADANAKLKRLVGSETTAALLTTTAVLVTLAFDEKYKPYQIFNITNSEPFDAETLKSIFEYGFPVFIATLASTASGTANLLTVGLLGADALDVRAAFDKFNLIVLPLVAAGSQAARALTSDSIAAKNAQAETKEIMWLGLVTNGALACVYIIPIVAPNLFTNDPNKANLVRVTAATALIQAVERGALEELSAFKKDEQSWFKTIGDYSKIGVPVVGLILLYKNIINRNLQNYIIIQAIALLPSTLNIIAAATYGT